MNKKILLAIAALALVSTAAFAVLAATSVQAKKDDKETRKAKIEWSQARVQAKVNKGEVVQTTLTFTPTTDITNAEFRITASMSETVTVDPSDFASLSAGTPTQVTVTFSAPTEGKRKKYQGIMALIDADYLYAKPLKLRFGVTK